jgi:ASC-1-like (ASCH) protein
MRKNSRTKRGDVLDSQELEAVWEKIETLQTMREALREQQFQAIIEVGVELQDILQEFKKLHNAYPCRKETRLFHPLRIPLIASLTPIYTPRKHDGPALQNTRIPQNPRKIRKKKKKQISPLSPPNTRARKDGPDSTPPHQLHSRYDSV